MGFRIVDFKSGFEAGWSHILAMLPNSCGMLEWQQNEKHNHKARFWLLRRQKKPTGGGEIPGTERGCRPGGQL